MQYTLTFILGNPNKQNECAIYLRVYIKNEADIRIPAGGRVKKSQFRNGKVKDHPLEKQMNATLSNLRLDIETKIHDAKGKSITKQYLLGESGSREFIGLYIDYLREVLKGKLSDGRLKMYKGVKSKIDEFHPKARFSDVSIPWLQELEASIRALKVEEGTVSNNMKAVKAILNRADAAGLIDEKQFAGYYPPTYDADVPVYLEEEEIQQWAKFVQQMAPCTMKTAGYYFLLACYAGYRISDLMTFDCKERISGDTVVLRARKNGNIVSIPIYATLRSVLDFCEGQPINFTEQEFRRQVKKISALLGMSPDLSPHSGRHSFAILQLRKGLTIDEIADLLGDSKEVARCYARITSPHLHRRVKEVWGE